MRRIGILLFIIAILPIFNLKSHNTDEVTRRWYITLGTVMLALSFVVILVWDTHFPWWAFIVCVAIPVIWTVPVGIIFATTNIQIGLNVFTEFVIGYMLPGRPVALMLFKAYG